MRQCVRMLYPGLNEKQKENNLKHSFVFDFKYDCACTILVDKNYTLVFKCDFTFFLLHTLHKL